MMRYNEKDKYDITNSHQHLFESAADVNNEKRNFSRGNRNKKYSNNTGAKNSSSSFLNNAIEKSQEEDGSTNLDLTLVGYACNIYRDDVNAAKVENKNNLIPWNGDVNLLIDRYDCRGYLYDLAPYDSDLLSAEKKNPRYSNEEIEMERICDEERYMFLNNDESEQSSDEEGGSKSHKQYGSVKFDYNNSSNNENSNDKNNEDESKTISEIPFLPTENLKLPSGMLIPETIKMNQIIVKTASFVVNQGLQMEILLKAKQASNAQFDFLNYDHCLNSYYKHLQNLIRTNQIDPLEFLTEPAKNEEKQEKIESQNTESDESEEDDDENYLHPLLSKHLDVQTTKDRVEKNDDKTEKLNENDVNMSSPTQRESPDIQQEKSVIATNLESKIIIPKDEIVKTIIDNMAQYVARNGIEFELNIKRRNEDRFSFLNQENVHYLYYKSKIEEIIENNKQNLQEINSVAETESVKSSLKSEDLKSIDLKDEVDDDESLDEINDSELSLSSSSSEESKSESKDKKYKTKSRKHRSRSRSRNRKSHRKHHSKHRHSSSSRRKHRRHKKSSEKRKRSSSRHSHHKHTSSSKSSSRKHHRSKE